MLPIRFSNRAEADLSEIGVYTVETWNESQAVRYLGQLKACFQRLAVNRFLGRPCESIRPGLRRYEQGRHVIFYKQSEGSLFIVPVLHVTMQPEKHISETDEQSQSPDNLGV